MRRLSYACAFLCSTVAACGSSDGKPRLAVDAAPDVADEGIVDAPLDAPTSDVPLPADTGDDARKTLDVSAEKIPSDSAPQTCHWPSAGGYSLLHFRFSLTTPDGKEQSPPKGPMPPVDANGWPIHDFEGRVSSRIGNQLGIDSCLQPGSCEASVYQFTLCDSMPCRAVASPAPIEAAIPVGRRVRVAWRLDNDVPGFSPGLYFLAIYDAEPGVGQGSLLFVGSGGRSDSKSGMLSNPLSAMPFDVATKALGCGRIGDAAVTSAPDDYAFIFTAKNATGASLQLAAGESGVLTVAAPAGGNQRLQFRCLDAVQPDHTDDYWNWDFWASGDVAGAVVDSGAGG